jgi:hypothetical protein
VGEEPRETEELGSDLRYLHEDRQRSTVETAGMK